MNALTAEFGFRSAIGNFEYRTEHWRAVVNFEAGALSRLSEGKTLPAALRVVTRAAAPARDASLCLFWPKAQDLGAKAPGAVRSERAEARGGCTAACPPQPVVPRSGGRELAGP